MAVVSCGSRRWCRAREPARYAATVSANCRRRSTLRAGGAPPPAADGPARRAHPRRAHRCRHAVPPLPTGAVERRSGGSYPPAPTIAGRRRLDRQASHPFSRVTRTAGPAHPAQQVHRSPTPCDSPEGVCRGGPPVVGRRRRARNLARDAQHSDLDRQPARLGAHRPDPRARHRPPHPRRRGGRDHGCRPARGDRPRPRPLLRRPGAERGRHRAGHDRRSPACPRSTPTRASRSSTAGSAWTP